MQPVDAANSIFLMAEKLSGIIDEMPDTSNLERLKIDACRPFVKISQISW